MAGFVDDALEQTLDRRLVERAVVRRLHVAQHTEGQLWLWLSDGFPGSAMPAFRTTLSDEDRWNIINYLESTYGAQASSGTAPANLGVASPR